MLDFFLEFLQNFRVVNCSPPAGGAAMGIQLIGGAPGRNASCIRGSYDEMMPQTSTCACGVM